MQDKAMEFPADHKATFIVSSSSRGLQLFARYLRRFAKATNWFFGSRDDEFA